jgi:hypothetical protein
MRLVETYPQRKRGVLAFFEKLRRPARDVSPEHVLVIARERQLVGVQPDARGILERPPGRLGPDLGRYGLRPNLRLPGLPHRVFGHDHLEAVQTRRGGTIEMHLAESRGPVAGGAQLPRQRRLALFQRRSQHRHAGRMGHLPGQERLPGRRRDGRVAVVAGKVDPLTGQPVQIRRTRQPIAVRPQHVSRVVVGNQEQQVGTALAPCQNRRDPSQESSSCQHRSYATAGDCGETRVRYALRTISPRSALLLCAPLQPGHARFPFLAQLFPPLQDVGLGFLETLEHTPALDQIAWPARRCEVARLFLAAPRPRNHKIHGHDKVVLETGGTVQPAILAAVMIPLENIQPFLESQRLGAPNHLHQARNGHRTPPAP